MTRKTAEAVGIALVISFVGLKIERLLLSKAPASASGPEPDCAGDDIVNWPVNDTMEGEQDSFFSAGFDRRSKQEVEHVQSANRLIQEDGRSILGAWGYRKLNMWHAEVLSSGLLYHPRFMLMYLNWRERDTTLAFIGSVSQPLPFTNWRPPVGGQTFWALWCVSPQTLLTAHAIPHFSHSYWAVYVFILMHAGNALQEVTSFRSAIAGQSHVRPAGTLLARALQSLLSICWFLVYWWAIWPFMPWFVCDAISRTWFMYKVMFFASKPMRCIWAKQWLDAAIWACFAAVPLVLDDDYLRDVVLHLVLNVLTCGCFAYLRYQFGRLTPAQIGDVLAQRGAEYILGKKVIRITEEEFLATSISELNKLKTEDLQDDKPLAVIYMNRTLNHHQQEGIDMGGLYCDWLTRAAEALLGDENRVFCTETVDGTEVLRLCQDVEPAKAMFVGRLLALSLKANVPLGWSLSEAQARLLLHPRVPVLLHTGSNSPLPDTDRQHRANSRWQQVRGRMVWRRKALSEKFYYAAEWALLGFNPEKWIGVAFGEGKANWFKDCVSDEKTFAERESIFEAGIDYFSELQGRAISLQNLKDVQADMVKSVFVHKSLETVWSAFHSVPNVTLPRAGIDNELPLFRARPSDWHHLASAILGELDLDVDEWRQHTRILKAGTLNVHRIENWFWQVMAEQFSQAERMQFFYWASSMRRLPRGGWRSGKMVKMTLNICSDSSRLPVAHTCFFQVDLPTYSRKEILAQKLREAMQQTRFYLA